MSLCVFSLAVPFSFVKHHLGSSGPDAPDVEVMKVEITELRQKVEQVEQENQELKAKLQQFEPMQVEQPTE